MTPLQIALSIFILFALTRVFLRTREKVIPIKTAIFWTLIWLVALTGVLLPATTSKLASFFGVGRGVDVIIYIALALLFYLVYRIYVMIEDLRHEITDIVRKVALKQQENISSKVSKK